MIKPVDPRELLAEDFRQYMTELFRRARQVELDQSDIVAFLFRWVVEMAPAAATNETVRASLVEAVDSFLVTRTSGSGKGPGADHGILGIEQRQRLLAALDRMPGEYRVKTDTGWWNLEDAPTLARYGEARCEIVHQALHRGMNAGELGTVLLELSASLLGSGMNRQTFLDNARLWYDSVQDADSRVNGPGGKA